MGEQFQVLYTAAHAVPSSERFPLGGGAAICRMLCAEWAQTRPFDFRVLGPELLGPAAPSGPELVQFSEREYARFCRAMERAATDEVLRHDPRKAVVLVNDVSEGPDFRRLAEEGFAMAAIYHVDVVAYVANIYLRGWLKPETTVRWYERLRHFPMPDVMKLVWEKQRDSVRYSQRLIMPSARMGEVMAACYPGTPEEKFCVLPWGVAVACSPSADAVTNLREEFEVPPNARVLLTLSRISPEKGQDILLEALLEWERAPGFPGTPLYLFLCGEPAFMQGRRHLERLRNLAGRLRHVKTLFPGHVTGERKSAFFAMADLYVFPSRHESYGLTLMEAFQAGLPAVCMDHHGAREIMRPEFGEVAATRTELWQATARMLSDEEGRLKKGRTARQYANDSPFSQSAQRLASVLKGIMKPS